MQLDRYLDIDVVEQKYEQYVIKKRSQAIRSIAVTFGLGSLTVLILYASFVSVRYSRWKAETLLLGLLISGASGVVTLIKGDDAASDWMTYKKANSGEVRGNLVSELIANQNKGVAELASSWALLEAAKIEKERKAIISGKNQLEAMGSQNIPILDNPNPDSTEQYSSSDFDSGYNPSEDLGSEIQSAIIAGVPGSGKDFFASNALRFAKQKNPSLRALYIDLKCDPKEKGYFDLPYCEVMSYDLEYGEPDDFTNFLLSSIEYFKTLPSPKVLIIGEAFSAIQNLKLASRELRGFAKFTTYMGWLASQGDSKEQFLWLCSQVIDAKNMGLNGNFKSIFRCFGLINWKNQGVARSFMRTGYVPFPEGGMEEIKALIDFAPSRRAFYDSKVEQWLPMPILENHSNYNRDERSTIAHSKRPAPVVIDDADSFEPIDLDDTDQRVLSYVVRQPHGTVAMQKIKRTLGGGNAGLSAYEVAESVSRLESLNLVYRSGKDIIIMHFGMWQCGVQKYASDGTIQSG